MNRPPRWLAGVPTLLFRVGLGWLLGSRFLMIRHSGRRTGRNCCTILIVVAHDDLTNSYYVAAGYGEKSDWYQNVLVWPRVEIEVGRRRLEAVAERVPASESESALAVYVREHKLACRWFGVMLGLRETGVAELAQRFPIVRLRITQPVTSEAIRVTERPESADRIALACAYRASGMWHGIWPSAC